MICVIAASMPTKDLYIPDGSYRIAADKGLLRLREHGAEPDLVVGDFDSLGYVPQARELVRHPVEKDDTDMLLAVREGLRRGFRTFLLYGGLGGRLDHTLANVQTLAFLAEHGARGLLIGEGTAVALLENGTMRFPAQAQGTVSVFCFGDKAEGVTETGLHYPLENACLTNAFPLGVSNAFCGRESAVSVQKGKLLLLWESTAKAACETFLANG
jgi:thiamine pyrophosphokinase